MKKALLLASFILISQASLAATNNNLELAKTLGSVWKNVASSSIQQPHNDINIVYGGQDMTNTDTSIA